MVDLVELVEDKHCTNSKEVVPGCEETKTDKLVCREVSVFECEGFVESKDVEDQKCLVDNHSNERTNSKELFEDGQTNEVQKHGTHADPGVGEELFDNYWRHAVCVFYIILYGTE